MTSFIRIVAASGSAASNVYARNLHAYVGLFYPKRGIGCSFYCDNGWVGLAAMRHAPCAATRSPVRPHEPMSQTTYAVFSLPAPAAHAQSAPTHHRQIPFGPPPSTHRKQMHFERYRDSFAPNRSHAGTVDVHSLQTDAEQVRRFAASRKSDPGPILMGYTQGILL